MATARRLYLYLVAAISLLVLVSGTSLLVAALLAELEWTFMRPVGGGAGSIREQLSLAVALIAVGLPIWLIHWWLIGRGLRGEGGREDRTSPIRALYFTVVRGVSGVAAFIGLVASLDALLGRILGVRDPGGWSMALSIAIVTIPVWALHGWARARELRAVRMTGSAAWLSRLYRYAAMYGSLTVGLIGLSGLVATVLSILVGRPDFGISDTFWRATFATQLSLVLVGLSAWAIHWRDAAAAIRDAGAIGEDDRDTRLRAAYFGAVLLTCAAYAAVAITGSIAEAGRLVLGLADRTGTVAFLENVIGPVLAVVPLLVAAWWHVRRHVLDAANRGADGTASADRLVRHLGALVGLAFMAVGSFQLLAMAIESLAPGSGRPLIADSWAARQVPWHAAQVLTGLVLWLPAWRRILGARRARPAVERAAATSRSYLFLVVGASLLASVPAATFILFRLFDTLLGAGGDFRLLVELSSPIGLVIVAAAIGLYHGRVLLADVRATAQVPASGSIEPDPLTMTLALRLPGGTDVPALVAAIRGVLPVGAVLEGSAVDDGGAEGMSGHDPAVDDQAVGPGELRAPA
jgi:hypothetical protein